MAGNYTRVSARQTEELVGGTLLEDRMEVGFFTLPSNVFAQARVDLTAVPTANVSSYIDSVLSQLSAVIEAVAQFTEVAALVYVQDVNAAGQLLDVMEITVWSTSGQSTGIVRVPLTAAFENEALPLISALHDQLNAIEAL